MNLLLAVGSATASNVALNGGMSIIDGSVITAIFTGMAAVISAIGTILWVKRREAKKRPLDSGDLYVRCAECAEHRKAINARIDALGPALQRIFEKLNENDKRSEERTEKLHRRLDPVIEKVAANSAKIDVFEELARQSTVGGRK